LNGATVEQFVLEDAEGLKFEDARVGDQVDTALKALRASSHDRSGREGPSCGHARRAPRLPVRQGDSRRPNVAKPLHFGQPGQN
jgi:hypothetical protein